MLPSTISRVVPATSVTIALFSPISLFKILLFPTLGLPTIATLIPSLIIFLVSLSLIISLKDSFILLTLSLMFSIVTTSISSYSG